MTRKCEFFALILLAFTTVASAQTTAGKTFTKAFNSDNKGTLVLDLPGTIDMKVWDNPSIKFEISVTLPAGNGFMLNELANIGRYNLASKPDGDMLVISAPNMQKQLKVKGEALKENISFVVFVPKTMAIQLPNAPALAEAKK